MPQEVVLSSGPPSTRSQAAAKVATAARLEPVPVRRMLTVALFGSSVVTVRVADCGPLLIGAKFSLSTDWPSGSTLAGTGVEASKEKLAAEAPPRVALTI